MSLLLLELLPRGAVFGVDAVGGGIASDWTADWSEIFQNQKKDWPDASGPLPGDCSLSSFNHICKSTDSQNNVSLNTPTWAKEICPLVIVGITNITAVSVVMRYSSFTFLQNFSKSNFFSISKFFFDIEI